ncbi:MAG: sterol desaturase family protein [Proteobacteria bacterium]|nr:sterol desaturase family protein [Pseudomonadota bacterium]
MAEIEFYLSTAVICMTAVLFLESVFPLHVAPVPLRRWLRNLGLSVLALSISLLTPLLFLALTHASSALPTMGLLAQSKVPAWGQWLIVFLTLEGLRYALHRLSHRLPWLWRLHAVHHSDVDLDATTTHRHHPLENFVSSLAMLPVLIAIGPPPLAVLAYTVLTTMVDTFSHGNLRLPTAIDKVLRLAIATPAYHRVHHSAARAQTDSNYAGTFPVFDYLFRSHGRVPDDGGRNITLGLETNRDASSQSLMALLSAPFRRVQ